MARYCPDAATCPDQSVDDVAAHPAGGTDNDDLAKIFVG
jgi:hypothetical protein